MNTVRTTIRIRKDLLDQSKRLALERGTSLQEVVNDTLAQGFGHVTDFDHHKIAMKRIIAFRERMRGKKVNVQELLEQSKRDQR